MYNKIVKPEDTPIDIFSFVLQETQEGVWKLLVFPDQRGIILKGR